MPRGNTSKIALRRLPLSAIHESLADDLEAERSDYARIDPVPNDFILHAESAETGHCRQILWSKTARCAGIVDVGPGSTGHTAWVHGDTIYDALQKYLDQPRELLRDFLTSGHDETLKPELLDKPVSRIAYYLGDKVYEVQNTLVFVEDGSPARRFLSNPTWDDLVNGQVDGWEDIRRTWEGGIFNPTPASSQARFTTPAP